MKKQEGITLIALVITIIVLLILAGVTIAMLTGENGLLTRAQASGPKQEVAAAKEEVSLVFNDAMAEYYEQKYVQNVANPNLGEIFAAMANGTTPYASYVGKLTEDKKHNCTVTVSASSVTITNKTDTSITASGTISGTSLIW